MENEKENKMGSMPVGKLLHNLPETIPKIV